MDEVTNYTPAAEPTIDTFSFFDVLEERTYPKDIQVVYMDEESIYQFEKLGAEIDETPEPSADQIAGFMERATALQEKIEASKFTFYLTGVSDDRIEDAKTLADDRFAPKRKQRKRADQSIEHYLPESEQLNYLKFLNAVIHSLHIEQVVQARSGRVMTAPSPDEVAHLWDKAPAAAKAALVGAIQRLRVDSNSYERSLDEGFFQKS